MGSDSKRLTPVTICDQGYVVATCTCPVRHVVREVPCDHKSHRLNAYVGNQYTPKGRRP